jgi:hypothetical protein
MGRDDPAITSPVSAATAKCRPRPEGRLERQPDQPDHQSAETSPSMVYRVRKQLVEEGFEAVLSRKQRATPAVG